MTDKELRRMSRGELLELLVAQMEENQLLQEQLEQLKEQMEDRRIRLENCGSIAEAALVLNGVFERAEQAAAEYEENLKIKAREEAAEIVERAKAYSKHMHRAADKYWKSKRDRADKRFAAEGEKPDDKTQNQSAGAGTSA